MGWLLNSRRGCITVDGLALLLNTYRFSRCLVEDSDSSIRWFWVRSNVEALCGSLFYENGVGYRFFGSSPEIGYELVVSGLGGVGVWSLHRGGSFSAEAPYGCMNLLNL
ncbi:unnamed protein product [Brassica oleracea var. botrytis]